MGDLTGQGSLQSYSDKVLNTQNANLIAYWRLQEPSGTNADNYEGTAARDGTYTGVTLGQTGIGDGLTVPLFDGANDFVDVFSSSLDTAFNLSEGSVILWMQVSGVGVWTDGALRYMLRFRVDGSNQLALLKRSQNNQVRLIREGANVIDQVDLGGQSDTDFVAWGFTWSEAADEVIAYKDGVQVGSTQTGLGASSGNLSSINTTIGSHTTTPAQVWDGQLGHVAIWDTPLSAAQMSTLATV